MINLTCIFDMQIDMTENRRRPDKLPLNQGTNVDDDH